jgi:hypothetical protein
MANRQVTVNIRDLACVVTPITAGTYYDLSQRSLPIFEDYWYYFILHHQLKHHAPDFDHPRLYAALKVLFGESTTAYDDYKCSFGYQFLLKITRRDRVSVYALNFTDIKGNISFIFRKVLTTSEELEKYKDRNVLREPIEDDFSKDEMEFFMTWFMFYLVGFMESFEPNYNEAFARSQDYGWMIYGFRDNAFFLDQYDDYDEFRAAKKRIQESGEIPFNRVNINLPIDGIDIDEL